MPAMNNLRFPWEHPDTVASYINGSGRLFGSALFDTMSAPPRMPDRMPPVIAAAESKDPVVPEITPRVAKKARLGAEKSDSAIRTSVLLRWRKLLDITPSTVTTQM